MPSESRNLHEQEISIKSRSHEVFAKAEPEVRGRSTKPFPVYLRETPASPMSGVVRAMLWAAAIVVALLFLAAVWKLMIRHGPKPVAPGPSVSMVRVNQTAPGSACRRLRS